MIEPLRVFVVEDEAVTLMQIEMLLEEGGHDVVGTAMDAEEAIANIRATKPDLVLLDLQLKDGSSGLDVARSVRSLPAVTVVYLTANVLRLSRDMDHAVAAISKPFNNTNLEHSIAYLEECVHRPPPLLDLPVGMILAPAYSDRMDGLRKAQ